MTQPILICPEKRAYALQNHQYARMRQSETFLDAWEDSGNFTIEVSRQKSSC